MTNQARILVVEDDQTLREAISETLQLAGFQCQVAGNGVEALSILSDHLVDLIISDVQMDEMNGNVLLRRVKKRWPGIPVVLITAYGTVEQAVQAIQTGATDYLLKPFEAEVLIEMATRLTSTRQELNSGVVSEDPRTQEVIGLAMRVAASEATVMISGESGTGKEVIARVIHQHSSRKNTSFVAINCAAIPETMLESILFGYEKGAFTGAYQARPGKLEQANGGTLLLDEISEMDLSLQAKLLRVLQEREVERLGGSRLIALDVRILATTNRNLREEISAGRFREDLFYRLNVFPLQIPPLRERPGDIIPLARSFVCNYVSENAPHLSTDAEKTLMLHSWPGNVRELENVIQRALILRVGTTINAEDIRFEESQTARCTELTADVEVNINSAPLGRDLKAREKALIMNALKAEKGSRQGAATRLGISPRTLRYKLAKLREDGVSLPSLANA